jgi:hypothetical protein
VVGHHVGIETLRRRPPCSVIRKREQLKHHFVSSAKREIIKPDRQMGGPVLRLTDHILALIRIAP